MGSARAPAAAASSGTEDQGDAEVPAPTEGSHAEGAASLGGTEGELSPDVRQGQTHAVKSEGGSGLIPQSVLEAAAAAAAADREAREHRMRWQARHAQRVAQVSERVDMPLFTERRSWTDPRASDKSPLSGACRGPQLGRPCELRLTQPRRPLSLTQRCRHFLTEVDAFTVYPRGVHAPDLLLVPAAAAGAGSSAATGTTGGPANPAEVGGGCPSGSRSCGHGEHHE